MEYDFFKNKNQEIATATGEHKLLGFSHDNKGKEQFLEKKTATAESTFNKILKEPEILSAEECSSKGFWYGK